MSDYLSRLLKKHKIRNFLKISFFTPKSPLGFLGLSWQSNVVI